MKLNQQTPQTSIESSKAKSPQKYCHNRTIMSTRIIMITTIITVSSIKTTSATSIKTSIMTSIKTSRETKTMTTCFSTCSFARVSSNTSVPELESLTLIESLLHLIIKTFHHLINKTFHHLILKETLEAAAGIPSTV